MSSAIDRLDLLLPWINGDHLTPRQVRKLLKRFVDSFDGSADAGHVQQQYSGTLEMDRARVFEPWSYDDEDAYDPDYPPATDEQETIESELVLLYTTLRDMLRKGLLDGVRSSRFNESLETLTIGVRTASRAEIKRRSVPAAERRAYEGAGAYVLTVDGSIREVITFLVAHLLTMPGMVALASCPAPAARGKGRCGRVLVVSAGGKGRPRRFCSDGCRLRQFQSVKVKELATTVNVRHGHRVTKGPVPRSASKVQ